MTQKTKAPVQTCGTCALWDAEKAKNKANRVRPDVPVRCGWTPPVFPISVPDKHIVPNFTRRDDGADCPCWVSREPLPPAPDPFAEHTARVTALLHEAYPHLRGAKPGLPSERRCELLAHEIADTIDVSPASYGVPADGQRA